MAMRKGQQRARRQVRSRQRSRRNAVVVVPAADLEVLERMDSGSGGFWKLGVCDGDFKIAGVLSDFNVLTEGIQLEMSLRAVSAMLLLEASSNTRTHTMKLTERLSQFTRSESSTFYHSRSSLQFSP